MHCLETMKYLNSPEGLKLREYKNQLNTLKEHNDDHIIQSDLEDAIREIEENR